MADSAEMLQQAINTLQTPVPEGISYQGVDLGPAQAAIRNVKKATENQQQVVEDAQALNETATKEYQRSQQELAAALGLEASANAAQAAQRAGKFDVYNTLTDMQNQTASRVAAANAAILMVKPAADAELAQIKEMQSVGLLDDPLEWAYNQIQLPSKIKSYNIAADEINQAQATINEGLTNINAISEGGAKNVPAVTAAQAQATAAKAVAAANINNAVADEQLAKQNVDFATKNTAAAIALAQVTENTTQLQQREAQAKYQSQINAINIADTKANRIIKSIELSEKLGEVEKEKVIYRQFDKIMGKPEGSTTSALVKRLPKEMQAEIFAIGSGGKYGFGPADALENFRQLGMGAAIPETSKRIVSFLVNKEAMVLEGIDKDITLQMASGKLAAADKVKERKARIDAALTTALNEELKDPNSKLMGMATPKEILMSGQLPQNSILAKLLTPLSETNLPVDIKTVAEAIKVAYPQDVREQGNFLAQYARLARKITVDSSNITSFGNAVRIPQGVPINAMSPVFTDLTGGSLNKALILDITKPEDATKFMLLQARAATKTNLLGGRVQF